MLDLYIKKYRPLLTATESTWLFPGLNGRAKCPERVAQQVSQACKTVAGLHVHMHLMRHIAAKLYLDQHPGAYGVVQRLLGHKLLQTTIGIYSGMEQRSTVAHFDNVILGLRS
jgi:site-specific recombinase XerD